MECNQSYIEVTYNLAIVKIALQIQSLEKPRIDNLFILLGSFYIYLAFSKAVRKFTDDCDITNIQ